MKNSRMFFSDGKCAALILLILLITSINVSAASAKSDAIRSLTPSNGAAVNSKLWDDFVASKKSGKESTLLDFSYAGYHRGELPIPNPSLKIFNVTDYGAVPDDGKDDQEAVQKTIDAAEANGGGIVFFPPGVFQFFTDINNRESIIIKTGNIVLRGSGATRGGTVLFQYHHGMVSDSTKKDPGFNLEAKVNALLSFQNPNNKGKEKILTAISGEATRNAMSLTVANAKELHAGQWIMITSGDSKAVAHGMLSPLTPRAEWTRINQNGIKLQEIHQIKSVDGNVVTLQEGLKTAIKADYRAAISSYFPNEELGIEDICFMGNYLSNFIHHRSGLEDYGWHAIDGFRDAANVWVRRVVSINNSVFMDLDGVYGASILLTRSAGGPGHESFIQSRDSHSLIGLYQDDSVSVYHNFTIRALSAGTVAWRITMHPVGQMDFHGMYPYATLIDAVEGGYLTSSGGPVVSFPQHLRDLTIWNFNYLSRGAPANRPDLADPLDYWNHKPFSVLPILAGMHGNLPVAVDSSMTANESYGVPVKPESLYEAQLVSRLGSLPAWVGDARAEWEKFRVMPLPDHFNSFRSDNPKLFNVVADISAERLAKEIGWHRFLKNEESRFSVKFSGPDLMVRTDFEKASQLIFNLMTYVTAYSVAGGTVDVHGENGKIVAVIKAMKEEPNSFYEKSKAGKIKNRGYIGEQHWHDLDIADNLAAAIKASYKKENRDGVSVIEVIIPSM